MRIGGIYAEIRAKCDKFKSDLNSAEGDAKNSAGKIQSSIGSLSFGAAIAGATALGVALAAMTLDGLKSYAKLERQMLRTESLIKATGDAAKLSSQQLLDLANQLDLATLNDREAILSAINAMQTFKAVSGETFTRAIELSVDLAEVLGTDLRSQVIQLGKALEDPKIGLTALRRVGVSFTASQKEMVNQLVESNQILKAQSFILDQIAGQVGGAAVDAAQGLSGKLDTLNFRWREFKESLAKSPAIIDAVSKSIEGLTGVIERLSKMKILKGPLIDKEYLESEIYLFEQYIKQYKKLGLQAPEDIRSRLQLLKDTLLEFELPSELLPEQKGGEITPKDATKLGFIKNIDDALKQYFKDLDKEEYSIDMSANVEDYERLQALQQQIIADAQNAEINPLTFSRMDTEEQLGFQAEMEAFEEYTEWVRETEYKLALERGSIAEWLTDKFVSEEGRKNKLIRKIQKQSAKQAWKDAGTFLDLMGQQNETAFEWYKKYKIAEATVSGIDSAIKAWNAGMSTGGPWAPVVAAAYTAASLAKTGALISSIQSTSFSGGGSINGGGGGAGAVTAGGGSMTLPSQTIDTGLTAAQETDRPRLTINIEGDFVGDEAWIDTLVDKINDAEDRDVYIRTAKGIKEL